MWGGGDPRIPEFPLQTRVKTCLFLDSTILLRLKIRTITSLLSFGDW